MALQDRRAIPGLERPGQRDRRGLPALLVLVIQVSPDHKAGMAIPEPRDRRA